MARPYALTEPATSATLGPDDRTQRCGRPRLPFEHHIDQIELLEQSIKEVIPEPVAKRLAKTHPHHKKPSSKVAAAIDACLSKEPHNRPENALVAAARLGLAAEPHSIKTRVPRTESRPRWLHAGSLL